MFFFTKSEYIVDFLEGMTDIHNHILPGIDDGSPDIETSIAMIKGMRDLGIKNCIATPHTMEDYYDNDATIISNKYKETQQLLQGTTEHDFIAGAASEYMIDGQIESIITSGEYLCIYKNYLLTELSYFQRPDHLEDIAFKISQNDLVPILAHPERYRYITSIETFKDFKLRGFELQLNLLSLTNHYGEDVHKTALLLLEKGMYDYVGTDAHKVGHLEAIKEIKVKKKYLPALEKLLERHKAAVTYS